MLACAVVQCCSDKRGELRQLAATKNKLLNSSASLSNKTTRKKAFQKSPALFGAGLSLALCDKKTLAGMET